MSDGKCVRMGMEDRQLVTDCSEKVATKDTRSFDEWDRGEKNKFELLSLDARSSRERFSNKLKENDVFLNGSSYGHEPGLGPRIDLKNCLERKSCG
ncbi:hypothetical protein CDAR_430501 [Caerostris darwini]|uniref:Uncharacterized protein n=1 Tax=Caerostris darwini TaxID=1538125 RepID=A0AAV4N7E2_9ARAC|nr:hypothetical protein CDAR_430501 [Caerostris darwini]